MNWWDKEKYNRIGRQYNDLTVLEQVSQVGGRRYNCQCVCGKQTEVSAHNLVTGQVRSCGCALGKGNRHRPFEWLYHSFVSSARIALHVNELTYEDFVKFTDKKTCHYCNAPVFWVEFSSKGPLKRSYNLDRMDNSLGYLKTNVTVCCTRCNFAKSDHFTYEEWVKLGAIIKTFTR
jgi:hypothetical protein